VLDVGAGTGSYEPRDRLVVLTWDPAVLWEAFWFVRDYVPVVREMERDLPAGVARRT
jgi:hypothetical protein